MKNKILLSVLTSALLVTSINAKSSTQTLMQNQVEKHAKESKHASNELTKSIQLTFQAVKLIETDKIDEAKKALKEADAGFSKILKAHPNMDLIPLEEHMVVYTFNGSSTIIQEALDLSKKLIDEHKTQVAIDTISVLKDELDVNIVSLPMQVYPASTKTALEALNKGDKKAALSALAVGFSTLVHTKIVIPTPLLIAQDMIKDAANLDKSKKQEAHKLLDAAKEQLKRAYLLGYTSKHTKAYKELNDQIDAISKELDGKNMVEKLYEKLKESFKSLIHDTRNDAVKSNEAKQQIKQFEQKEQKEAIQKASKFQTEAKEDMKKTIK
jgi:hypothetical protein